MKALNSKKIPLYWVSLLRILMGILFLTTWASNLSKGFYTPAGLEHFFLEVFPQSANPLSWYANFIYNGILPIKAVFAPIQLVGEFILGFALLVGAFTPLTSLFSAFFIFNTFLATYGHDWPWSYALMIAVLGVIFITKAGRSLGVDGWLFNRYKKPPNFLLW